MHHDLIHAKPRSLIGKRQRTPELESLPPMSGSLCRDEQLYVEHMWQMWKRLEMSWQTLCCLQNYPAWPVRQWSCGSHRPRDSSHQYRDETLRPNTGAVGPAFLLVQDNAQVDVVRVCKHYLDHEVTDATDWTPHSPHLNPAVNRWDVNVSKTMVKSTVEDPVAHWCPVPNVVGHLL